MGKPSGHGGGRMAVNEGEKGRWGGRACSAILRKSQPAYWGTPEQRMPIKGALC